MRISDWSSDVCSSDLRGARYAGPGHRAAGGQLRRRQTAGALPFERPLLYCWCSNDLSGVPSVALQRSPLAPKGFPKLPAIAGLSFATAACGIKVQGRSEEHTSELPSLLRNSNAV